MNLEQELLNKDEFPEKLEFLVLKTQGIRERIIVIIAFLTLYVVGVYYSFKYQEFYSNLPSYITAKSFMVIYLTVLLAVERLYDSIVRSRRVGKGEISKNHIIINGNQFNFSEITMLWVNYGLNTIRGNEVEYLFKDYETIKLTVIDENNKKCQFHIDNESVKSNGIVVSDYIEYLKNKYHFFKIHFHDQKRFSKKEYEKTLKRYAIMQNSVRNRGDRNRRK